MKHLILYDLDGTLVDTEEDIARAVNYMLTQIGSRELPAEVIRAFVGRGLHELIAQTLETPDPDLVKQGVKYFEDYYLEHLTDSSLLYPGASELLDHFKDRKQAVFTNKPNPFATDLLVRLDVARHFMAIVAGGSGYPKKPDPAGMLALMDREGVRPEETLFIGDSVIDIETGRKAGVLTAVITHGFSEEEELRAGSPDLLVQNFTELLQVAKQAGW